MEFRPELLDFSGPREFRIDQSESGDVCSSMLEILQIQLIDCLSTNSSPVDSDKKTLLQFLA